jgi:site-specific recombinase XerD
MVPLINGADATLRWFIADVWGHFDDDHTRPGAPLFPSERRNTDGTCRRVGDDALRAGLAEATTAHLPTWVDTLTPHVMRHYCASQLYLSGLDLISIQELLGHSWIASTLNYIKSRELHQAGEKSQVARSTRCWSGLSGQRVTAA